jgi:hypothetical protein
LYCDEIVSSFSEYTGGVVDRATEFNDTARGVEHAEGPGGVDDEERGDEGSRDIDKVDIVNFVLSFAVKMIVRSKERKQAIYIYKDVASRSSREKIVVAMIF